ncbi:MAG: vWA domain-containing protein [Syntrophales bacterium]
MAEEVVLTYDLDENMLPRGAKNRKIITRLCLYAHDDFVKAHPVTNCDVILVIDTSGSMDEPFSDGSPITKRQGVLDAAKSMIGSVKPDDTLSLICYDSNAYLELDHVPGNNRQKIEAALMKILEHNGGTNFEKAFRTVLPVAEKGKNASRKVVFLTDGNNMEGNLINAHSLNHKLANDGITVDCLGVGNDFDFAEMQKFSVVSNGRTDLLDVPQAAGNIFGNILREAQTSLIQNAVIRLAFPAGTRDVELYALTPEIRYFSDFSPRQDGSGDYRINLQSLNQITNYFYLVSLAVDLPSSESINNYALMNIRVDFDVSVKGLKNKNLQRDVIVNLTDGEDSTIKDGTVSSDFLEVTIEKLHQQCEEAGKKKDWKKVATYLQQMKKKAEELRDEDKKEEYQRRLNLLVQNGTLSQADLNILAKTSTKSIRHNAGQREANNENEY